MNEEIQRAQRAQRDKSATVKADIRVDVGKPLLGSAITIGWYVTANIPFWKPLDYT